MVDSLERNSSMAENGAQPHILVVDDARDIREPLVRYLKESGYRATPADSAAARQANAIRMLILDVSLGIVFSRIHQHSARALRTGMSWRAPWPSPACSTERLPK